MIAWDGGPTTENAPKAATNDDDQRRGGSYGRDLVSYYDGIKMGNWGCAVAVSVAGDLPGMGIIINTAAVPFIPWCVYVPVENKAAPLMVILRYNITEDSVFMLLCKNKFPII